MSIRPLKLKRWSEGVFPELQEHDTPPAHSRHKLELRVRNSRLLTYATCGPTHTSSREYAIWRRARSLARGRCRSAYAVVRRARLHIARGPCTPDKSLSMHRCCHASCCRASSCCRSCCRASLSLLLRCREREGAPFTQARPASAARTLEP